MRPTRAFIILFAALLSMVVSAPFSLAQTRNATAQTHNTFAQARNTTAQARTTTAQAHNTVAQTRNATAQTHNTVAQTRNTTAQARNATSQRKVAPRRPQTVAKKPLIATQKTQNAQSIAAHQRAARAQVQAQYKKVAYAISGKAHDYPEGEWVKLCEPGEKGLQAMDSVRLKDGAFAFRGTTLSIPKMAFIVMGEGAKKTLVELFLEEGNINVDITAAKREDHVSGTLNNNIYSPYRDSINLVYTDLYNCIRETYKPTNSKEDKEAYQLGADSMRRKLVTVSYEFASKNLNNWVGIYLFAEYYKRFTTAQNRHLLALVPKKYANLPIISEIKRYCK